MALIHGRSGGRRRALAEINVVPYIDVMLVLLIIFMVTAPLITPSSIHLPDAGQASRAPDTVVEVEVKADHTLGVRLRAPQQRPSGERDVDLARLGPTVAELAAGAGAQQLPVMIAADRDVKYDEVIQVLNRLRAAGVQRVGLAVQASGGQR